MSRKPLKVGSLLLDLDNPRIIKATSQREALQKIIADQDMKLAVLAESIVEDGLNPMDRFLVLRSESDSNKFVVLEGNRRLAALKLLHNPNVLRDLEVRQPVRKRIEQAAKDFDVSAVEPVECYVVPDRATGAMWIQQRHTGENEGSGIVNWSAVARSRFRGRDPALQALDLVINHGDLKDADREKAASQQFPLTTLDRLLSTRAVRDLIGVEIDDAKLMTALPPAEVIRPLKRLVLDLANKVVNVNDLKKKDQQVAYAKKLGKDLPDLTKRSGAPQPIETFDDAAFTTPMVKPKRKAKPKAVRRTMIPKGCALNVTNPKITEIYEELRRLPLADYPHAISVLFRVFLEQSTDIYLTTAGIPLTLSLAPPAPRNEDKNLRAKVGEAIKHMIANGTPAKNLDGVSKGIDNKNSPLYVETLHNYVHNVFYSPTERDLTVAWDNSQPYFEKIWP
jgi:hypothetical protein